MPGVVIKYINMAENKEKLTGSLTTEIVCVTALIICVEDSK